MNPIISRLLATAGAGLSFASAHAAEPTSLAPELVKLPEFQVVTERLLPPPENWHYAKVGRIEFLSNASSGITATFIRDFQEFQSVLAAISPQFLIQSELPTMVVVCSDDGNPFEIPRQGGAHTMSRAITQDREMAALVMDVDRTVLNLATDGEEEWEYGEYGDHRPILYRSYITHVLNRMEPPQPNWMIAGTAEIYAAIDFTQEWIDVASKPWFLNQRAASSAGSAVGSSRLPTSTGSAGENGFSADGTRLGSSSTSFAPTRRYIMPLGKLFSYTSTVSPLADREDRATPSVWRLQCGTFVHMCLYGENGKFRESLAKFIDRSRREGVSEALFKECFRMTYKQMEMFIRSYMDSGRWATPEMKADKGKTLVPKVEKVTLRAATDGEVGRIKGETYRLAGFDDRARQEFIQSYLRGDRDPQLLASLGLMARQRGEKDKALLYLELAEKSPTPLPRPRAYLELMRLRHEKIRATQGGTPLTPEQVTNLLKPLLVAKDVRPVIADVYREIANVWENAAAKPTREDLAPLEAGIALLPQNGELIYRSAALHARHGYKDTASARVEHGLKVTRDADLRKKLEALKQTLPPPAEAKRPATR